MNDLTNKIAYQRDIKPYLAELQALTSLEVTVESLLPVDQVNAIRDAVKESAEKNVKTFVIPFHEKDNARFASFVQQLESSNAQPVYIWTERSNSCGLFEIPSISKFNFSFEYTINPEGIIGLTTKDSQDRMTLDFYEEDGEQKLEVELRGEHWPTASY